MPTAQDTINDYTALLTGSYDPGAMVLPLSYLRANTPSGTIRQDITNFLQASSAVDGGSNVQVTMSGVQLVN